MASKKTEKTATKKEIGKSSVKASRKSAKTAGDEGGSKKSRRRKIDEDDRLDLIPEIDDEENAPDDVLLDEGMEAEEREASRLDLEEVAKQADRIENQQTSDGDGADGESKEDQLALESVVPA